MKNLEDARCKTPLRFPLALINPPALHHIAYRIGTYDDFRAALFRGLDNSPALANWTYRGADDPGIALLEGAAILSDVLTLYQEVYANETFLRTATWRESVADLVRLVGYRLAPGLGGLGLFALELRGDIAATVPAGFPLEVQLADVEQPAVFQTVESLIAYPWMSRFSLYRPVIQPPLENGYAGELIVEPYDPETLELNPDDRLLVGRVPPGMSATNLDELNDPQIVVVDETRKLHGRLHVAFRGGLRLSASRQTLVGYKIDRTFHHFGHNAPPQEVKLNGDRAYGSPITYFRQPALATTTSYPDPPLGVRDMPLDVSVDDLALGRRVAVSAEFRRIQHQSYSYSYSPPNSTSPAGDSAGGVLSMGSTNSRRDRSEMEVMRQADPDLPALGTGQRMSVRRIDGLESPSMRWGSLTGSSTRIIMDADWSSDKTIFVDIRKVQIHEITSGPLKVRAKEVANLGSRDTLRFFGSADQASVLAKRRIAWLPQNREPVIARITHVAVDGQASLEHPRFHLLTLDTAVEDYDLFPVEGDGVEVFANLVDANQGKSEKEAVLGNGDGGQSFQTFVLPKAPLTYHYQPDSSPPQVPQLEIWIEGRQWQRVDSLFGRGPEEQIFIVREDSDGKSHVQFGDGKTGARLPSGIRNVIARYRSGNGARGPIKSGTKVQAKERLDRFKKAHLIGNTSGGSDPEEENSARMAAPGKVQALDRLVSIEDYEREAAGLAGVLLARARWAIVGGVPTMQMGVLVDSPGETIRKKMEQALRTASRCRGADRFPIDVQLARFEYVYLDVEYEVQPGWQVSDTRQRLLRALGVTGHEEDGVDVVTGFFSLRQLGIGQAVRATQIEGHLQNVEGVAWVKVVSIGSLGTEKSSLALPVAPVRTEALTPADPNHLLRLYSRPDDNLLQLRSITTLRAAGVCDGQ